MERRGREEEEKSEDASGGQEGVTPSWTSSMGEIVSGWKRGRGRACVGEAGISPAMPSLRSWLAGEIPASQARRPFGASLKEFY